MRTKSTIINFLSEALPQLIIAVIGIFKINVFLQYLGEDVVGLYQLYGNLFAYLTLAEVGIMGAVSCRLYKPVADGDNKKIEQILSATKIVFRYIGLAIFVAGFFLSFGIGFFIKNNNFDFFWMQLTFMLFLFSNVINYFTVTYKVMFDVTQKRYVMNNIFQPAMILKSILELIVAMMGFGLEVMFIIYIIINLVANGIAMFIFKKKYGYLKLSKDRDYSMLKDVKHLAVHKVGELIASNIDIVLISKFIGLGQVVVYSTYNYIILSLKQVFEKLQNAISGGIGNLLATDKEKAYDTFLEYHSFMFFLGTVICVPLYFVINSFITIVYHNRIDTSVILAGLFVFQLLYSLIRQPLIVYATVAGLFKETRKCPIIESVVNFLGSIILIHYMGIPGVLLATLISYLVSEFFIKPKIIYTNLFKDKQLWDYYRNSFIYIVIFICLIFIYNFFLKNIKVTNLIIWFMLGTGIFIVNFVITAILYFTTGNLKFFSRLKSLKRGE